ncbi:MAG TPA: hypothetical protein VKZ43_01220 [Trueperaceae bacterium]|nr:hypothetical protein [Trueperaceae bacterium]
MRHNKDKAGLRGNVIPVALLILLLGACVRYPPPAPVAFPDDPRVLHGTWEMSVTGLAREIDTFYLDSEAENLIIWDYSGSARAFQSDDLGDYFEVDAAAFDDLDSRHFDRSIDAVVSLKRSGSTLNVHVVPVAGGPTIDTALTIPAGMTLRLTAAGSGRTFMVLENTAGERELRWWDSQTGAPGGTLALPRFSDDVRLNIDGRALLLWDLDGWRVSIILTADPESLLTVPLGACRSNGAGEVSADGRWFVFADCADNLRVADLTNLAAGPSPLGLKHGAGLTFAVDSPVLVWVGSDGVVNSLDMITRARTKLYALTADEKARLDLDWVWWRTPLYLNRSKGLLALVTGDGRVTLVDVATQTGVAALPRPEFETAQLELLAESSDALSENVFEYLFSGVTDLNGIELRVEGTVFSYGLHEYLPTAATLAPQALPPPRLNGSAQLWAAGEEEPGYSLWFGTTDRQATNYLGTFSSADGTLEYTVRLQRAVP